MTPQEASSQAKRCAIDSGFARAGIASASPPPETAFFKEWIARGFAGEMGYLARQAEQRSDLRSAFPWARSVLCVALQYDTPVPYSTQAPADRGWISRYAWGDDYHAVMLERLMALGARLEASFGRCTWRAYVDTGPIDERAYAHAAGLGAWGKNTCLLDAEHGSWFFLGEIVSDLDLAVDAPQRDMCGTCTACLDACPTQAFAAPYVLDARRCISYLTIELKGSIPEALRPAMGRHVFGCDICQDVCPWNRKRKQRGEKAFEPRPGLHAPRLTELGVEDAQQFRTRFRKSPALRAKRRGLARNVAVALGNLGDKAGRPLLKRLGDDEEALVREHAQWALDRL